MYEKDGMEEVSGLQTCRFFMSSMVESLRKGWSFSAFDLDTNNVNATINENLQTHLGLKYAGKEWLSTIISNYFGRLLIGMTQSESILLENKTMGMTENLRKFWNLKMPKI